MNARCSPGEELWRLPWRRHPCGETAGLQLEAPAPLDMMREPILAGRLSSAEAADL